MKNMLRVSMAAVFVLVMATAVWASDESSDLTFVVLRDYNGKPIKNASVILHPVNSKGKQERGGFELKTDTDGKTSFNGVPYGVLRVQVLAPGFQTYGEDYTISQAQMTIEIKLKRPSGQFSVYDDKGSAGTPKTPDKQPPATPDQKPQ